MFSFSELGISIGVGLGGAVFVAVMWLAVFGLCMLIKSCPLRKAYFEKPIVTPTPDSADSAT